MNRKWLLTVAICCLMGIGASAQPSGNSTEDDWWKLERFSGDWNGWRTRWAERGVEFTIDYTSEIMSNVSGGSLRGTIYEGLGYVGVDADLNRLAGWNGGAFHVSTMWIHGASPGNYAGNELAVSNIDAYDGLRLHQVFVEQEFGQLSLRTGSLLADEDFVPSMYRDVFLNDSFGQTVSWSANTLNGGPAFFAAGLGLRALYEFNDAWYAQAGVYDGDIYDDASGDPTINQHGVHFELGNGQGWTSLYQVGYNGFNVSDGTDLPGWYRLTAWYHSSVFDKHDGSKSNGITGVFASVDQLVYREEGDQGLGVFGRFGISERDRARFHWTFDAGLHYTGLIPGRAEDVTGLALIYGKHSSEITTTKSHEYVAEMTYQFQLSPAIYLQPAVQYINRPSGDSTVDDAWVFGLRAGFTF